MDEAILTFWNWSVAVYLFIAGVSAGAFIISSLAYFLGKEKHARVIRIGAYIAPFPVIIGILCLIFDLERPQLFWKLLVAFQPGSVMWLGTWLLLLFSILSFVHFYIWLPPRFDLVRLAQRLPEFFDRSKALRSFKYGPWLGRLRQRNFARRQGLVAALGILVSVGVGIYTGILLGALSARPFWNSPILPLLFLLSAAKTGTASISLAGLFFHGKMKPEEIKASRSMIQAIDIVLMVFSAIAVFLYVFGFYVSPGSYVEAVRIIMGGEFTVLFWVFVVGVGIVLPLILEFYELSPWVKTKGHTPWLTAAATASVLLGGFMLRYVVVYAGQIARVISTI